VRPGGTPTSPLRCAPAASSSPPSRPRVRPGGPLRSPPMHRRRWSRIPPLEASGRPPRARPCWSSTGPRTSPSTPSESSVWFVDMFPPQITHPNVRRNCGKKLNRLQTRIPSLLAPLYVRKPRENNTAQGPWHGIHTNSAQFVPVIFLTDRSCPIFDFAPNTLRTTTDKYRSFVVLKVTPSSVSPVHQNSRSLPKMFTFS